VLETPKRFADDALRTAVKQATYRVECAFYAAVPRSSLTAECFCNIVEEGARTVLYLEDLSERFPNHDCVVGLERARAAARYAARFHTSAAVQRATVGARTWVNGTYWSLERRAFERERMRGAWKTLLEEDAFWRTWLARIPAEDAALRRRVLILSNFLYEKAFEIHEKVAARAFTEGQVARLTADAVDTTLVHARPDPADGDDDREHVLLHGDFKAENLFFTRRTKKRRRRDGARPVRGVAACDFQFVGPGNPAQDLVHLVASSLTDTEASPEKRDRNLAVVDAVLDDYAAERDRTAAGSRGAPTAAGLRADFRLACADFARYVLGANVYDEDAWLVMYVCDAFGDEIDAWSAAR